MASESETVGENCSCRQGLEITFADAVAAIGKNVNTAFQNCPTKDLDVVIMPIGGIWADIKAIELAHKREVESYRRLLMTSQCALEDEIAKNQNFRRDAAELEARLSNAETVRKFFAGRIDSAKKQVAELRECLSRRSGHINTILQKALELGESVPVELRKVMDECIVEEDKAMEFGVFSSEEGAEDEGR